MPKLIVFVGTDKNAIQKEIYKLHDEYDEISDFITPEDGKHPWKQVEEIEDITAAVSHGYTIALFTNSPYMVDHLSTLMLGREKLKEHKSSTEVAKLLLNKNPSSLIDKKNVEIYCIENGKKKKNILRKDGSIDWKTFSEVSEYVVDQYFKMEEC